MILNITEELSCLSIMTNDRLDYILPTNMNNIYCIESEISFCIIYRFAIWKGDVGLEGCVGQRKFSTV